MEQCSREEDFCEQTRFEQFCGGKLWDQNLTWNTEVPDFTLCFQNSVLVWVPCSILWLLLPFYSYNLCSNKRKSHDWNKLNGSRTILAVCLVLVAVLDILKTCLEYTTEDGHHRPLVYLVSPAIRAVTMILVLVMTQFDRRYGVYNSVSLATFWFFSLIAGIVTLYSYVLRAYFKHPHGVSDVASRFDDVFRFNTFCAHFAMVLISLILSCFSDLPPGYDKDGKTSPEVYASFLSHLTLWWFNRFLSSSLNKNLDDMWDLSPQYQSKNIAPGFQKLWKEKLERSRRPKQTCDQIHNDVHRENGHLREKSSLTETPGVKIASDKEQKKNPSLILTLIQHFKFGLMKSMTLHVLAECLYFADPMVLSLLLSYMDTKDDPQWKGFLYASLFLVVVIVRILLLQRMFVCSHGNEERGRSAMISTIYKKALTMSNEARKNSTVGEIVSMMSTDVDTCASIFLVIHWIVWVPIQIVILVYLLFGIVGSSMLAGLSIMILMVPVNGAIIKASQSYDKELSKLKAERIKVTNEVMSGIKVLKLYAWEPSFEKKIADIREKELTVWKKRAFFHSFGTLVWTVLPILITLATFGTYVLLQGSLDAHTAFVSMAYIGILRHPVNHFPHLMSFCSRCKTSAERIEKFLSSDDIEESVVVKDSDAKHAVSVEDGTFSWARQDNPTLKNINLNIKEGSLVAIVGQVGAGKSSLISAMLGEMEKIKGHVTVKSSIAYASQQAWVQHASVKNNILFGASCNNRKYQKVLKACALEDDLKILPGGDQCEIGEKGINLSGGQKQRVSLARAVYNDADIYLMDDPLSAVDSHVGKHIFENVIGNGGLLKTKTRVLVTHGIQWLPYVDRIIVLVDGRISEMGSYEELMSHDAAFAQFLKNYGKEDGDVDEENNDVLSWSHTSADFEELRSPRTPRSTLADEPSENIDTTLIQEETVEVGNVKLSVLMTYMDAVGWKISFLVLLIYLVFLSSQVWSDLLLTQWATDPTLMNTSSYSSSQTDPSLMNTSSQTFYLTGYGVCAIVQGVLILLYEMVGKRSSSSGSRVIHSKLLHRILRAPMSFFDTTPTGRIVNRFAKDVSTIDSELNGTIIGNMRSFMNALRAIFMVCFSTPIFVVVILPLSAVYYFIQRAFIPSKRQLNRLLLTSSPPIYSHFSETLNGACTIRAFSKQEHFIKDSDTKVDYNENFRLASHINNWFLHIRIQTLGGLILFSSAMLSIINKDSSGTATGLAALATRYALEITHGLCEMLHRVSWLETHLVSMERVKEYLEIDTEAEWTDADTKPPIDWPNKGAVEIDNHSVRYRKGLDLVIKGISCQIKPQEKIGIVGRTGAGKSSLTLSLFRIIEAASGAVKIDGVNIDSLGLHDLRSKLTILPQDPVMFAGTLRMNLDPFDAYSDEEITHALKYSHLKNFVDSLDNGLSHECGEGGQNLSVGQRQLVCLARSLLRKTKILILDEATAAVDLKTDDLIQQTIRTEFADCTVLTIAHRLNTILDNDKVMVLDQGEIKEFDSPENLLKNKKSAFYSMAKDAGLVS